MGHAILAAKKLCNDALDSTPAHDCIRVTTVGSDDTVLGDNAILKTNCNSFLQTFVSKRQTKESQLHTWPIAK